MLAVKVVADTGNSKLGPGMAATYSAFSTCPETCSIREQCYGRFGFLAVNRTFGAMHQAGERRTPEEIAIQEADEIRKLPADRPLRIHVVGDCKTKESAEILAEATEDYLKRAESKLGKRFARLNIAIFGYTHAWRDIPRESWGEISILASCESPSACLEAMERGYPAAVILPHDESPRESVRFYKTLGIKLRPCLHDLRGIPCRACGACMDADRLLEHGLVIGLRAHATSKRKLSEKIRGCRHACTNTDCQGEKGTDPSNETNSATLRGCDR